MLVAPTEPRELKALGVSSLAPEKYGVDVLIASPFGSIGVQRKTITDYLASLHDGRLQRELSQMQSLAVPMLMLEGNITWTTDGRLTVRPSWTYSQHMGSLWSIQSRGIWYTPTINLDETVNAVVNLARWGNKASHDNLKRRPKVQGAWGRPDHREFAMHLLQSFDGIGPKAAGAIYDTFGIPLIWTVTRRDLATISGVGKTMADVLISALEDVDSEAEVEDNL
jgi:ERCC4-type nuclease